jgi:hypothetical protein
LVYAQTHQTQPVDRAGEPASVLSILTLADRSLSRVTIGYDPVPLPATLKKLEPLHFRDINLTIEVPRNLQDLLTKVEFFPAFKALRTDGDLIFLFRFQPMNEELDVRIEKAEREGEDIPDHIYSQYQSYTVDIVDAAAGRLAGRAVFSCIPDVIRAGRAYRLFKPTDDFPRVECYRVNPDVYGTGRSGR